MIDHYQNVARFLKFIFTENYFFLNFNEKMYLIIILKAEKVKFNFE